MKTALLFMPEKSRYRDCRESVPAPVIYENRKNYQCSGRRLMLWRFPNYDWELPNFSPSSTFSSYSRFSNDGTAKRRHCCRPFVREQEVSGGK
jgi:hypothetical protein